MQIHHLNCGSMRVGKLRIVVHCLLIETEAGLILVDTGWGLQDYANPTLNVRWVMRMLGSPTEDHEAAIRQIKQFGFDPQDVKHIVMTHMHIDHSGGLRDFPHAKIHIYEDEYEAVMHPRTLVEKNAYIQEHWSHQPDWAIHCVEGEKWFDFDCTPPIEIGSAEIHMVPLPGHSRGHCGIAVKLSDDRWMFHCADTYTARKLVDLNEPFEPPSGIPGMILSRISLASGVFLYVPRLRDLRREMGDRLIMLSSHDAEEFEEFQHVIHT